MLRQGSGGGDIPEGSCCYYCVGLEGTCLQKAGLMEDLDGQSGTVFVGEQGQGRGIPRVGGAVFRQGHQIGRAHV